MVIKDLELLKRNSNQDNLYDLTQTNLKFDPTLEGTYFVISDEEEMRVDLVSYAIYDNVDSVDYILTLNDIDNPLNIMSGDYIKYIPQTQLNLVELNVSKVDNVSLGLINTNKKTKIDPNREIFVSNNYSFPPTFNESGTPPAAISGNKIILGNN
jgi:hypothetical protein